MCLSFWMGQLLDRLQMISEEIKATFHLVRHLECGFWDVISEAFRNVGLW